MIKPSKLIDKIAEELVKKDSSADLFKDSPVYHTLKSSPIYQIRAIKKYLDEILDK